MNTSSDSSGLSDVLPCTRKRVFSVLNLFFKSAAVETLAQRLYAETCYGRTHGLHVL